MQLKVKEDKSEGFDLKKTKTQATQSETMQKKIGLDLCVDIM